jgi:hypothetical protein
MHGHAEPRVEHPETVLLSGPGLGPKLEPEPEPEPTLRIEVRTLTGRTTTLAVHLTDTIWKVKGMIEAQDGVPASEQRLLLGGTQLLDELTMEQSGVMAGTTLHLALRLAKTAPQQSSLDKHEAALLDNSLADFTSSATSVQ